MTLPTSDWQLDDARTRLRIQTAQLASVDFIQDIYSPLRGIENDSIAYAISHSTTLEYRKFINELQNDILYYQEVCLYLFGHDIDLERSREYYGFLKNPISRTDGGRCAGQPDC